MIGATGVTIASRTAPIRIGASRGLNVSAPESDIVIKAVRAYDGEWVRRGQVLFELEDDVFRQIMLQRQAALATARAELERVRQANRLNERARELTLTQAEAGIRFRQEDLNTRKSELDVLEKLNRNKAAQDFEYFEARSKLSQARYEFSTAELNLQLAKNQVGLGLLMDHRDLAKATNDFEVARIDHEVARHDVDRCQIKSPIDGFITKVDAVPGVVASVSNPLTTVLDFDPIHVRMDFPQERIDEVAIGQRAEVVLDSFPKETFSGKVIRLLPQVKPDVRVMPVIVELKNPNYRIKPGISGFVRLRVNRTARTVPSLAVIERGGKAIAFKIEDGRARLRELTTGPLVESGLVEVRAGLDPGDEVVVFHSNFYRHGGALVSQNAYLQDNDPVDVDWRKWTRRE
ncbi:MAG: efflux RND transporter periplasmic adaptor subunit [Gemmataceae bacterium]|nr:efflux RND transporter periplasmic adaptor subunit [Gemmataceae bacterium]